MRLIRVAAAILNQTPLAWDANLRNIRSAIEQARERDVQLLCLPELCITGYGCEDAFQSVATQQTALEVLSELLPDTRGMLVCLGLPVSFGGWLFNTACLVADGEILGFVGKQNLAGDGIHYEPRWFKPWPPGIRADLEVDGRRLPIGDLIFDCGNIRLGFEICEDAWVAQRPGGNLSLRGVDIILNPSASHFAFGKHEIRRRFVLEGSRAFGVTYVYANLLGNEAGRAIYDGGAMIASAGRMLAAGSRFSFADVQLADAVVDIDVTRMTRAKMGGFRPTFADERERCVQASFVPRETEPDDHEPQLAAWELGGQLKEEEFTRAVSLALYDYLRKSRSHGLVVSLSGGADSSAVAALVALMVRLGVSELGAASWTAKLSHIPGIGELTRTEALVQRLLTCVYQGTRNSSETTRQAAATLADALHARFHDLDVDDIVQSYVDTVSQALGRELTWEDDDLALQNIQARARAPSVWLIANLQRALLLSTSNRSEAAVGYATMDGDTAGGLSPIAGIDKAFLRHWLRWMETAGPDGHGPIPPLHLVNAQQPTAELRPPAAGQTDESDLMPYDVLDDIERAAIRDKLSPLEVYRRLSPGYGDRYEAAVLHGWVRRFFQLWSRNQWKRERYAPSFHLDDENLDPKTWCRFPILSGGFERELRELDEMVNASLDDTA